MPEHTATGRRGMTIPEFATLYRLGRDRVRAMVRRGELKAIDVAPRCGKPRWIIMPHHLAEWERSRQAGPPPKAPRRRRRAGRVDYFPDY
jgi:hypothetical protein